MSTRRGFERRFLCGLLPDMALHAMLSEKLIERVYPEIDRNLGELLPHAERHVVVSDHIVRLWTEPFRSNPSRTTGTRIPLRVQVDDEQVSQLTSARTPKHTLSTAYTSLPKNPGHALFHSPKLSIRHRRGSCHACSKDRSVLPLDHRLAKVMSSYCNYL